MLSFNVFKCPETKPNKCMNFRKLITCSEFLCSFLCRNPISKFMRVTKENLVTNVAYYTIKKCMKSTL